MRGLRSQGAGGDMWRQRNQHWQTHREQHQLIKLIETVFRLKFATRATCTPRAITLCINSVDLLNLIGFGWSIGKAWKNACLDGIIRLFNAKNNE